MIEKVIETDLLLVEQKYLDIAKTEKEKCYNINFIADKPPMSDNIRMKMKLSRIGKIPWNKGKLGCQVAWNKGMRGVSEKTRKKMSDKAKEKHENKLYNYDNIEYSFKNLKTNEFYKGIQYDFRNKYGLSQSSVCRLVSKKYKSCKNWGLI